MTGRLIGVGLDNWDSLKLFLLERYADSAYGTLEEISHNRLVILERVDGVRRQKMLLGLADGPEDEAWLDVATVVAEAAHADPWHELARNCAIRLGSIGVDAGLLWFSYRMRLRTLSPPWAEFLEVYGWMARTGDKLEQEFSPVDRW
jgi:hypothetical protein